MYEIQICPIKKLMLIAGEADLDDTAALVASSFHVDTAPLKAAGCPRIFLHRFDDITAPGRPGSFTDALAEQIAAQVRSLPRGLDTLFVCCDSGQSRSSAMAAAILRCHGGNELKVWDDPRYHPNTLVYRTLCRAFGIEVSEGEAAALLTRNEQAFRDAARRSR